MEAIRRRLMAEMDPWVKHDKFGDIDGSPVGSHWDTRKGCANAGVHTQHTAGIVGSPNTGASSICTSRYYDDDDHGDFLIYVGTGGQRSEFGIPTGEQIEDQSFEHPSNAALARSKETRNPVRVIRGPSKSIYAPDKGYRYDGLYTVENHWYEKGPQGFLQCKFKLVRKPGQPPLPMPRPLPKSRRTF
ncbi:PUA-like domain-containing protein [Armillaria luteobubalina]|uniref:PUA-like domain-containing protein n=1 Tax=Armillaria luteobubalina TaxID=153913 RepID=A0AA39Q885_9AGAR|nr:PUA-like domain-containing protein [Armillaria luteobubalina]